MVNLLRDVELIWPVAAWLRVSCATCRFAHISLDNDEARQYRF